MPWKMTADEWKSYVEKRRGSYGFDNEPQSNKDLFDWLLENESEEEKSLRVETIKQCVGVMRES